MNKQELLNAIICLSYKNYKDMPYIDREEVLRFVKLLDEPQTFKLKDVIARIKKLDSDSQEVWLNEILNDLGSDYGSLKYRAGYEQGRFDVFIEREKVTVPQFVADWIKYCKNTNVTMIRALLVGEVDFYNYANQKDNFRLVDFLGSRINQELFACAWLDGYTVEKEKRYLVKMKDLETGFNFLNRHKRENYWVFSSKDESITYKVCHTRKELEEAGFGEVFDSPLFEVEEVE